MASGTVDRQRAFSGPLRRILTGVISFVTVSAIAVAGYVLAGWQVDDAIYMVMITVFGVGYGEVQPIDSPALRMLTILVIVAGYAAVMYTVGGFMQMLIDGELKLALGARRMTLEIDRLTNHTIICGVGRVGTTLAAELKQSGKPFVVVDLDEPRLQAAEDLGYLVLKGDATEEHVLEMAGIKTAKVLATVLSADATNVFVTITARAMNPNLVIIARGEDPRTEKKLLGCGANKVVLPTAIGAKKLAQMIIRPSAEHMLEQLTTQSDMGEELGRIGLLFHELAVAAESPLVNKPLSSIELHHNHGFLIVGLRHLDGTVVLNPPSTTVLAAGDVVIVLGHDDDIPQLLERFSAKKSSTTYRGVTIQH